MIQSVDKSMERVPIEEAIECGWNGMKKNFWKLLGMFGVVYGAAIIHAVLNYFLRHKLLASLVVSLLYFVLVMLFWSGLVHVMLKIVRNQDYRFTDLFAMGSRIFHLLGAAILSGLVISLGMLCLIVPGIILAIKLQYFAYFVVDKSMGPIQSLKASWEVTKDVKLKLILFSLVTGCINALGFLALIIGVIPASMIIMIANTYVYIRLVQTAPDQALSIA